MRRLLDRVAALQDLGELLLQGSEGERFQQEVGDSCLLTLLDDDARLLLLGGQADDDGDVIVLLVHTKDPGCLDAAHGHGIVEQDHIGSLLAQCQNGLGTVAAVSCAVPFLAQLGADQPSDLLVFLDYEDLCGHEGDRQWGWRGQGDRPEPAEPY